ncbi:hypothetical protein MNB_SM-4-1229 [hydrothermal vent metagenome]|uniref:Uncharacterized protein n=1 Tax=hydrothermal vent metagenome TaxID=652676 RepID=A0A1W1CLH2_9ZZZZ
MRMRRGSAAVVPLLLAVMLLFWFIAFMGNANDTLHDVNNVENLLHLQKNLLVPVMKHRYELSRADEGMSDQDLQEKSQKYVNEMMIVNKIQK